MKWETFICGVYDEKGQTKFPHLSNEILESFKKTLGSYIFANQYLNQIIPSELQTFKKEWFRYFDDLPKTRATFILIDPALSEADTADFTGIVVVHVGSDGDWYVPYAQRHRINPTELVQFVFRLNDEWKPSAIGIEEVAYQKALLYFIAEEMRRRNVVIPVTGVKYPTTVSKQTKILSLVPRLEFGHLHFARGLTDLELELLQFPRGSHDDLIDALASIEKIAFRPEEKKEELKKPHSPNDPSYERWRIQEMMKGRMNGTESDEFGQPGPGPY